MELQVQAKWCRLAKRNHEHLIIVGFIVWIVYYMLTTVSSVQFSRSVMSDSLWPHELQHARPPCPSPTPGVHPNPCPLSQWCHPAISSPVIPFSSCPQSFPASGSFQMNQLFASGGQSIGVSTLHQSIQWTPRTDLSFKMEWLDLLAVQETLRSLLQHHSSKASILRCSASQSNSHIHTWPLEKP